MTESHHLMTRIVVGVRTAGGFSSRNSRRQEMRHFAGLQLLHRFCHCYAPKSECSRPSFREDALSDSLISVIEGIQLTPDMKAGITAIAEENAAAQMLREKKRLAEIARLKGEVDGKTQQRITAGRKHIDGTIDAADYTLIVAEIDDEIALLRERITQLGSVRPFIVEDCDSLFKLLERVPELYRRRNIEERARMLRVVTSKLELTEENILPVYRKPFSGVAEYVATGKLWACLDSNQGPPAYQASALTS